MAANVALLSASSPSTSSASPFLSRRPLSRRRAAFPRRSSSRLSIMAALGDDPIRVWILTEGKAAQIKGIRSIGGGCINSAQRYDTDAGPFFVKTNSRIGPEMFEGEALGLKAMYDTKSIRVPLPYKVREVADSGICTCAYVECININVVVLLHDQHGDTHTRWKCTYNNSVGSLPTGGSFIIMEFIEFGRSRGDQSVLGRKLAEMHKAAKSNKGYGFHVENTIGSTPQINTWTADWIEFYSKHRLGHQLELASRRYGDSTIYEKGQRLIKNIHPLFDGAVLEPCLLHGDLWSGNISSDTNGDPVILDPACYYGHNEAEFGMSWCAGFGGDFYNAYFQVMPKQPGFEKRRDLYLLYHYLNHYNLFGSVYRSSAMSIIEDYLYLLAA